MNYKKEEETEQQKFLSACSQYDYDVLTGKLEMTQNDYLRITHLTISLGFIAYTACLLRRYPDIAEQEEQHQEREHEIYLEYLEYYEDESIYEQEEQWVKDFLDQMPKEKRDYFEQLLAENENY